MRFLRNDMEKMTFVLCSSNKNKIREFRQILSEKAGELLGEDAPQIEILSLYDIGFSDEIVEDGATFEENAMIKAAAVSSITQYPCIADDSGLCVRALGGEPGIYSARYAGEHGNDAENIKKLLSKLEGVEDRDGYFVSSVAYAFGNERFTVRGEAHGKILYEPIGNGGFGYDPVFECSVYHKSYAELTADEKNGVSHRRRAIEALADRLFKNK